MKSETAKLYLWTGMVEKELRSLGHARAVPALTVHEAHMGTAVKISD